MDLSIARSANAVARVEIQHVFVGNGGSTWTQVALPLSFPITLVYQPDRMRDGGRSFPVHYSIVAWYTQVLIESIHTLTIIWCPGRLLWPCMLCPPLIFAEHNPGCLSYPSPHPILDHWNPDPPMKPTTIDPVVPIIPSIPYSPCITAFSPSLVLSLSCCSRSPARNGYHRRRRRYRRRPQRRVISSSNTHPSLRR